ncbi:hypothetical protein [Methylobacterium gnaphalii]|uniref:Uncharacterized protein n=1 Tax=Methylobacterium gnaphalii TaxID=1010610 RepID=A0A512JEY1_9HYPH|nr:hypothetical protein [Methylobacterium gnaphalii]GEP08507.1 hypothetical protein MGN01_03520 [Methylobacterium gnaphalii]GJD71093.1 hypothetical protein MMMDOFMJ_4047 [Methylobacterium gnaphalii]GLS49048.1 hypothetical protein GCM10007885_18960 [Methylobacterium gnaphalii]
MTTAFDTTLPRFLAIAGLALIGGCAQEGDFGRPAPGAWNTLIDSTGSIAARLRDEPSSPFPLTDDEQQLRDRAWRFLMPAQGRAAFLDVLANLTRARVLPPNWREYDIEGYHDDLLAGSFRSPVSRYARLSDDATADGRLIPPFAAFAARVIEADKLRLHSLPFTRSLNDDDVRNAAMRVAENRCLIAWVRLETGLRVGRYRYALEHFIVEMPGREAVGAERAVAFLDERRQILAGLLPPEAEARCGLVRLEAPLVGLAPPVVAKY